MESNQSFLPSGYDCDFIDVPEECVCRICEYPMRKPVQTKCGHRFCKDCLDEANKSKRRPECPMDRQKIGKLPVFEDKAIERKILSLLIKCSNGGCPWQGELRNCEDHKLKCDYKLTKCTMKHCDVIKPKIEMTYHIQQECKWREVTCPHCQQEMIFLDFVVHENECLKWPVVCPNECEETIKREEVEVHISNECSMSIVPCMYHRYGCDEEIRRKFMKEHIENTTNKHLELISNYVLSTRADVDILSIENTGITADLNVAKMERIKTTNEVDYLNKKLKTIEKARAELAKDVRYNKSNNSQRFESLILYVETLQKQKDQLERKVKHLFVFVVVMMLVFVMIIFTSYRVA